MIKGLQTDLFGNEHILKNPIHTHGLDDLLLEAKEIVQKAIIDHQPYATGLMLSGGDDSITALKVALMLGVKIDFILHGITGTGLSAVLPYVKSVAELCNIPIYYADAGNNFENYVRRKGFFGVGARAHKFSYHVLKQRPFRAALSKYIRKRVPGRRIMLLNGVRVEESENRADNYGDNPYRMDENNNIWVNIIHWFTKANCLHLLECEGFKRSPVAIYLNRSGECNCGTMQNDAARLACKEFDPAWWDWLWRIRQYAIQHFGFDINQNPDKKRMAEINKITESISDAMPMCVGCKARNANQYSIF